MPNAILSPPPELMTATTCPSSDMSGPPLLPGLTAASVWIASGIVNPVGAGIDRFTPLTIPDVTVPLRLNGLPIATTLCPIVAGPGINGIGDTDSGGESIAIAARSLCGSVPTTDPVRHSPCEKRISAVVASPVTCAFVITWFESYRNPVP